jgi:predicted DNA-binding transcriptional regulator AlpA
VIARTIVRPVHESTLPALLRVEELAALLGMTPRNVYRSMKRPDWLFPPLPGIDSRPRWSRDQVLAILASAQAHAARRRLA